MMFKFLRPLTSTKWKKHICVGGIEFEFSTYFAGSVPISMSLGTPPQICAIELHYIGASIERLG